METENKTLTREESVKVMHSMIIAAQGSVRASSFYFLFWGWIVLAASLGHFLLDQLTEIEGYWVWLITIPGWIISFIYGYKESKTPRPKTYIEDIVMWTWIGFGLSVLIIILCGAYINYEITAMIMLFAGFSTFITGITIRFKPLIFGGSSFWIFAPITLYLPMKYATLLMALAILVGYLIPGYVLKRQNTK
ncbi:MAG: hypothetical protein R3345_14210 [Fulvivirga sp.]|nr:hypothetical protein [Fulvivirga sp.]